MSLTGNKGQILTLFFINHSRKKGFLTLALLKPPQIDQNYHPLTSHRIKLQSWMLNKQFLRKNLRFFEFLGGKLYFYRKISCSWRKRIERFQEPESHPRNVQIRFVKPINETYLTLIREMNWFRHPVIQIPEYSRTPNLTHTLMGLERT